ncbi:terminase small subunit [Helcococcus sueciensis]|uniref:terminase small subunit n=1 Tax=Helcococcus sueciensis TaxID=241555 RepID=UPI000406FBD8|nr:terminase small subunit [Helcococcus sueciensis]
MTKLTIKQKKFADEYIISGNATEAAKKAGYSKKTASVIGAENLIKPNIKKYIEDRLKEIEASKFLTMEEALQITASIARGEPRIVKKTIGYEGGNPEILNILESPNYTDSLKALEHYYKINGKFTEKQEIDIKPIIISGGDKLED